jgi:hypothetical protein
MSRATIENEDELYLHSIPYLQFPLLLAGKPFTGERALIPGIHYVPESEDFWTKHCRDIWKAYQAHPNGPYSYGWWDSVPGRPQAQRTHAAWLAQYAAMVEEGTWAWLQIGPSTLFKDSLPSQVVVSVFANREIYLALANYGRVAVSLETSEPYVAMRAPLSSANTQWQLGPRSLLLLKRSLLS